MASTEISLADKLVAMFALEPGDAGSRARLHERLLRTVQSYLLPDACALLALNPETRQVNAVLFAGEQQELPAEPFGLAGEALGVLVEREALFVENVADLAAGETLWTPLQGVQAFAATALLARPRAAPLAVLYIGYRQPHRFSQDERETLQLITRYAAQMLQLAWLLYRYTEIVRIGQDINHDLTSLESLFKHLRGSIGEILDVSYALMLAVYRPQTETLDYYFSDKAGFHTDLNAPFEGGSRWVIEQQQPLLIQNLNEEKPNLPTQLKLFPGTEATENSLIFVPLMLRSVCLGVLSVQHPQPYYFDADDLQVLQLLGNHVALAINTLRLFANLQQVSRLGQQLTRELESADILQHIVGQIREGLSADVAQLYPYQEAEKRFEPAPYVSGTLYAPHQHHLEHPRPDDIVLLSARRDEPIFARDAAALYVELGGRSEHRGTFMHREAIRSVALLPLFVGDERVGVLFVNYRRPQLFDAPQRQVIRVLASYAAIAIKNLRKHNSLMLRRLQELEAFQEINRSIGRSLDLDALLQTILDLAIERIAADAASILLVDRQSNTLRMEAAYGRHLPFKKEFALPLDQQRGLTLLAFTRKRPLRVGNVLTDPELGGVYVPAAPNIRSEMDVPLLDGDSVVGVINFESAHENAFSQADEDFLKTLGNQAVLAIKNAQDYERERRIAAERQAIIDISREIISQLNPELVFRLILEKALAVTKSQFGSLHLYDERRKDLRLVYSVGLVDIQQAERIGLGEGVVGLVARERRLYNIPDVQVPRWRNVFLSYIPQTHSELAVPLIEDGRLRGVLNIESQKIGQFEEHDERLLAALADLAVVAIQNAERYQLVEKQRRSLDILHQIDRQIITQLGRPDEVIRTILGNALQQTSADEAHLDLHEDGVVVEAYLTRRARPGESLIVEHLTADDKLELLPRGIVAHVAATRRPYRTGDAQNDPYYKGGPGINSEIAVPLLSHQLLFGVLNLESSQPACFSDDDERLLELLAGQAVIAIQSARNYALNEERGKRLLEAETMSSIGLAALELAHHLSNDLGPIRSDVNSIRHEIEQLPGVSATTLGRLDKIILDVRSVLDLSSRLRGELAGLNDEAPEKTLIDVRELLEEAAASISDLGVPITVTIDVKKDTSPIFAVGSQINDILHNLLLNAIDAMPQGGAIILRGANAGNFVNVQVSDTGVGMNKQQRERAFDLFYSTKGSFGFGLWSSKRYALANGGSLDLTSAPDSGTTFTLSLPKAAHTSGEA
jgi:GAF domain-containing protein